MNIITRLFGAKDSMSNEHYEDQMSKLRLITSLTHNLGYSIKDIMEEYNVPKKKAKYFLHQIEKDGYNLIMDKETKRYRIEI